MDNELKYFSLATTYEVDETFDSDKFIKMRLRVCHDGLNPNNSSFDIEDMNRASGSIANIPVLANVIFDENDEPQFGSHDISIEKDKANEGEYRLIYKETPIGIIPETNNYEIAEFNGKNYVYVDAFIYRGYSNYAEDIINRDKDIKISMEITVDKYQYDNKEKFYQIIDYRYKGITFLNNDLGTGMENALGTTETFSIEGNKEKILNIMSELKEVIDQNQSFNKVDIDKIKNAKKGGDIVNEKLELLQKYNLTIETIDFEIEELSLEEVQAKIDEFVEKNKEADKLSFSATYKQKREALSNALDHKIVKDDNDEIIEETYFWVNDFDNEFVYVEKYHYTDNDSENTYGRFTYTFDEEAIKATISGEFEEMVLVWLTKEENQKIQDEKKDSEEKFTTLQTEFETYKSTYQTPETDVEILRTFQSDVLTKEHTQAVKDVFMQFEEKLNGNEEFETLKTDTGELSLEQISDKCFSILGKKDFKFTSNTQKPTAVVKLPVSTVKTEHEPYGGLHSKYGIQPKE